MDERDKARITASLKSKGFTPPKPKKKSSKKKG